MFFHSLVQYVQMKDTQWLSHWSMSQKKLPETESASLAQTSKKYSQAATKVSQITQSLWRLICNWKNLHSEQGLEDAFGRFGGWCLDMFGRCVGLLGKLFGRHSGHSWREQDLQKRAKKYITYWNLYHEENIMNMIAYMKPETIYSKTPPAKKYVKTYVDKLYRIPVLNRLKSMNTYKSCMEIYKHI